VRAGGTLLEKVHRIQRGGMEVWCGMIMGFDNDDASIFDAQRAFIQESRIALTMIGMLHAIPKTPLHDRLAAEGRLDPSDECEYGTNVIPLQIGREELREGYLKVMNDLYEPDAFFARMEDLYIREKMTIGQARARHWRKHRLQQLRWESLWLVQSIGLFVRLMQGVPEASLRKEYRRRIWRLLKVRQNPGILLLYIIKIAQHYHAHTMAKQMSSGGARIVNSF
jgi:hypothetical protein